MSERGSEAYNWTCCGYAFVPDDFFEGADLSEQDCPECGSELTYTGTDEK